MWKALRTGIALVFWGCVGACSAEVSSGGPGRDPYGGQTGSLVPECGVAPLSQKASSKVPAGDGAFVLYSSSCRASQPPAFKLRDATGALVTHHVELLDDGVYLVRTDVALLPGSYSATPVPQSSSAPVAGAATITVGAPSPLPTQLGILKVISEKDTCGGIELELTLDEAALAYAPLLRLLVSIDAGAPKVWVDYGTLPVQNGKAWLRLPRCFDGCRSNGAHQLSVVGTIAGEMAPLPPVKVDFTDACWPEESACAFQMSAPTLPKALLLPFALSVLLAFARRRRTR